MPKKKINIKSLISTILCLGILIGAAVFGFTNYNRFDDTVDSTIYFDATCSYKITANRNNAVIAVIAVDEASAALIEGEEFRATSIEDTIIRLLDITISGKKFSADDGLLLGVQNQNTNIADSLQTGIGLVITTKLAEAEIEAYLSSIIVTPDEELNAFATKHGISLSKAAFAIDAAKSAPDYTPDQLAEKTIREIQKIIKNPQY